MVVKKPDIQSQQYTWEGAEHILGEPTRRLFDRFNGNQVLLILNAITLESPGLSLKEVAEMEDHIRNSLPIEAKSEISVFNWLKNLTKTINIL